MKMTLEELNARIWELELIFADLASRGAEEPPELVEEFYRLAEDERLEFDYSG